MIRIATRFAHQIRTATKSAPVTLRGFPFTDFIND